MGSLEQYGITKRALLLLCLNMMVVVGTWVMTLTSFKDIAPIQVGALVIALGNTAASWLNKSPENPIKTFAATPPPGTITLPTKDV